MALSPLTAGVFERQRELEEALAAKEDVLDERGRLLFKAKAAIEALHSELMRTRREADAYQSEARACRCALCACVRAAGGPARSGHFCATR
jgi:chromosome segregation ATPase